MTKLDATTAADLLNRMLVRANTIVEIGNNVSGFNNNKHVQLPILVMNRHTREQDTTAVLLALHPDWVVNVVRLPCCTGVVAHTRMLCVYLYS